MFYHKNVNKIPLRNVAFYQFKTCHIPLGLNQGFKTFLLLLYDRLQQYSTTDTCLQLHNFLFHLYDWKPVAT